ncbi:hypothetical protein [Thalassoroseus pseudoceratinae]|uniref:hypothetical protein n=1 Tax=Thalassoroseus pseudoceratinae TaxID=2713176 RepID=UPI0014241282|nr:hypothetical protein [Thalassoroseus pseudoceratinae]
MTYPSDQESTPAQDAEDSHNSTNESSAACDSEPDRPSEELESGLPEVEELTPEIVEEQAWRNDVMLRLAVVLLAFLFGFSAIDESATLVHIRSGEYTFEHGGLPPRTDVLSYTAEGQNWINRNWLFDVVLAGVHQISPLALTVVKALIAAGAFWLLIRVRIKDVPTWWGSVCAILALVACLPLLTAQPELITLLGTVVLLWLLNRWQDERTGTVIALPILFLVWANLDPRMFLGLALLVVFSLGETIQRLIRQREDSPSLVTLWIAVAGSLIASIVHPFGWQTLLAPVDLYSIVYPTLRDALSVITLNGQEVAASIGDETYWTPISPAAIAGVTVLGLAIVTLLLNWRNFRISHLLLILVAGGAAAVARHELGFAAIVAAAVGTLNAQQWYIENFRSEYSTELRERLFSVGGRAVTALAFMMLALAFLLGRLDFGRRAGIGFSAQLRQDMRSVLEDTKDIPQEHHGLNVSYRDGDLLIWSGHKPFIDSRLELFGNITAAPSTTDAKQPDAKEEKPAASDESSQSLLNSHQRMFAGLDAAIRGTADDDLSGQTWIDGLKQWHVTHFYSPFLQPRPTYEYYAALIGRRQPWVLTRLGTAYAILYRTDVRDESNGTDLKLQKFIVEHLPNPGTEVYKAEVETPPAPLLEWPKPQPWLTQQLYGPPIAPDATQRAKNYNIHLGALVTDPISTMTFAHIIIREARRGLAEDPSAIDSYRLLADGYTRLGIAEEQFNGQFIQRGLPRTRRYLQAISACHQALSLNPDDRQMRQLLMTQYEMNNRPDLLLRQLDWFLDHWESDTSDNKTAESRRRVIEEQRDKVADRVKMIRSEIDKLVTQGAPMLQVAGTAYQQGGCVEMAIGLLDSQSESSETGQPPLNEMFLRIQLYLESGRIPEALELVRFSQDRIAEAGSNSQSLPWQQWIAYLDLSMYRNEEAAILLSNEANRIVKSSLRNLLATLPLATRPVEPFPWFMQVQDDWVLAHALLADQVGSQTGPRAARLSIDAGMTYLELGRSKKAGEMFRQALEIHPETTYRPLMAFYIGQITGNPVRLMPPSMEIPIWNGMFAEGPAVSETSPQPAKAEKPAN